MSQSITKNLGSALKWSGRYSFFFFIIALILTATTITLADPTFTDIYLREGEVGKQTFTLDNQQDVAFAIFSEHGERLNVRIEKLTYQDVNSEKTYEFRSDIPTGLEVVTTTNEVASASNEYYSRVLDLPRGEYQILVELATGEDASTVFIGDANFNLGLIIATAIMWTIFSVIVSAFFTILPFWCIAAIISAASSDAPPYPPQATTQPSRKREEDTQSDIPPRAEQVQTQGPVVSSKSSTAGPDFLQGTSFEKLTRKDWGWLIAGFIFFIIYLSNPFDNGALLFLSMLIFAGVAYSYFEREKNKDRIEILLKSYPKASIAFVAEQLDKDEDYIVDVLRIMILDEGYPIRLDLVNRSVFKIGAFPEEFGHAAPATAESWNQAGPRYQSSVQESSTASSQTEGTSEEVSEEVAEVTSDEGSTIVRGNQGEINEPWAYCQACGEGLKKKVKYCYSCGAKQYQ